MLDHACLSAVAALEDDPFYRSISEAYAGDVPKRRAALARYFDYSIQEGSRIGRSVHLAERSYGVAVWLLPQPDQVHAECAQRKRAFLGNCLGKTGSANYHQIVEYMSKKSAGVVGSDAWYLSIVAVDPTKQGQGLGRQLLAPTMQEADSIGATSYLETFSQRSVRFYERLGFSTRASFQEPRQRPNTRS